MSSEVTISEEVLSRAEKIVETRFARVENMHEYMVELKALATDYTALRLHNGRGVQLPSAYGKSLAFTVKQTAAPDPWDAVKQRIKLPSLPSVISQLQDCIEDPDSTVDDLARIISLDPKLSAALLNLVNSAMFGMHRKIDSIIRAVTIAGSKQISSLALCVVMTQMFQDTPQDLLDMELFWKHSVVCGILGHVIAMEAGKFAPERFFAMGLLHDMGRAALYSSEPELAKRSQELALARQIPFEEAERLVFNFDHSMVGSVLFREWNLPEIFVQSTQWHHDQKKCIGNEPAEVTYVANAIATAMGYCCNPEDLVPDIDVAIWESIGIPPEQLRAALENIDERIDSVLTAMMPST